MWWININILQRSFILLILFLFFNASLIEKCKALKIKIEVFNFINDINILIYDRITESIYEMLSWAHNICAKWTWIHDVTFVLKKYEFTHFTCKSNRFDMMTSLCIEESVVKLKSDVWIFEVQLNMKLWWDSHLQQIKADHIIKMLMFNQFEIFIWKATFAKTRQIYSTVIRLKMMFEALIWYQHDKKEKLLSMKWRLKVL